MMLTWKVFVIIISVVTLSLVNVNSSSEPSSSGASKRPKRTRTYTPPSSLNPVRKEKDIFKLYDQERDRCIEVEYNKYNPFEQTEIMGYDCFKQLRLFCDTEYFDLTSGRCAHGAILMYKKSFMNYNDGETYLILLDAVHTFFWEFPLTIKAVGLPIHLCEEEANTFMSEFNEYQVYFEQFQGSIELLLQLRNDKVNECLKELKNYQELVVVPEVPFYNRHSEDAALKASRKNIVNYALMNGSILGMDPNSFEVKYLEHISKNISSSNTDYNPHVYCRNLQNEYEMKRQTQPRVP